MHHHHQLGQFLLHLLVKHPQFHRLARQLVMQQQPMPHPRLQIPKHMLPIGLFWFLISKILFFF